MSSVQTGFYKGQWRFRYKDEDGQKIATHFKLSSRDAAVEMAKKIIGGDGVDAADGDATDDVEEEEEQVEVEP